MAQYGETTARALDAMASGARSIADLAKILGSSRSNAASVIGRLLRNGHVGRQPRRTGTVVLRRDLGGAVTRPNIVYFYSTTDKGLERLRRIRRRQKRV